MVRRLLRTTILLAVWSAAPPVAADPATPEDYLRVLAEAPWPLQILAYCYGEVGADLAWQETGRQWTARNGGLLATIEAKAATAAIPEDVRRKADEASLAAIVALAARQSDKAAWCATIARVVDSGAYDIDQRADLREALKRIFGVERD